MNLDELRQRLTIPLWPDTGRLLGLSKNTTYKAAQSGEIPTLRIATRYVVSTHQLLKLLGIEPDKEQP